MEARKFKRATVIIILLCGVILGSAGFCQDSAQDVKLKTAKGRVCDLDWVGGKLVVRVTSDSGTSDEISFQVSDDTQITKGADNISLADINLSDTVTVEYYTNSFAGLKATHVTVWE